MRKLMLVAAMAFAFLATMTSAGTQVDGPIPIDYIVG